MVGYLRMHKSQETRDIFIDREAEVLAVYEALDRDRCVLVVGPSGVGKTALARFCAKVDDVFISLFGASTEQEALFRVARKLGMAELPAQAGEAIERIGRVLAALGPITLILDHVDGLDFVPFWMARWLDQAPELRIIGTKQVAAGGVFKRVELECLSAENVDDLALLRADRTLHTEIVESFLAHAEPSTLLWLALMGEVDAVHLRMIVGQDVRESTSGMRDWIDVVGSSVRMPDPVRTVLLVRPETHEACMTLSGRLSQCFEETWLDVESLIGFGNAMAWFDLIRRTCLITGRIAPKSIAPLAVAYVRMCKWSDVGLDDLSGLRRAVVRAESVELSVACMLLDVELGFIGRARGSHVDCLLKLNKSRETASPWVGRALQTAGARLAMHVDAVAAVERFEVLAQTHPVMERLEHLLDLGAARLAAFRVADANDAFQAAMDLTQGLDPRLSVRARLGLAQVSWRLGYTERARAQFDIAMSHLPEGPLAAQTAHDYGVVLHHLGQLDDARRSLLRAWKIWSGLGDEVRLAAYHIRRGLLEMEADDHSLARLNFGSAVEAAKAVGDVHLLTIARACASICIDEFDERAFRAVEENVMVSRDPEAVAAFSVVFGTLVDAEKARMAVEAVERLLGLEDVAVRDICDASINILRGDAPPLANLAPMFRTLVRYTRPSQTQPTNARELLIHNEAHWFALNGEVVELLNRKPLRRILESLLQDWRSGGDGMTVDQVMAAGWPGEIMEARSGANRVYATIRLLRKAGLEDAILNEEGLYRLDPGLSVRVSMVSEAGRAN
jgi:tetratricopeptide (TPR) repeat protein